jgi:hypothetical protein
MMAGNGVFVTPRANQRLVIFPHADQAVLTSPATGLVSARLLSARALEEAFHVEGDSSGQPDLDWTSIRLLADHEVLAPPTTDELFGFRGHKEGLLWVRLGKPRALMDAAALEDHEQEVTALLRLICASRVQQSRRVTFPHSLSSSVSVVCLGAETRVGGG